MYLLTQWDALNEYCCNGWVEIDHNLCENALRVVALGRRNYMFFGSDSGGDSAAVMYSLIGSCKLNGIEPEAWLRHVISVSKPCKRSVALERHLVCKLNFILRPSLCAYPLPTKRSVPSEIPAKSGVLA